jgi:hypothetical protein
VKLAATNSGSKRNFLSTKVLESWYNLAIWTVCKSGPWQ